MAAMSIFFIVIIASKARFASLPPAASASVSTRGVICQESPQRSLHQPHALSAPPLPTVARAVGARTAGRSEEHTSELQSHSDLVCRLLLEKKKVEEDGMQ